MSVTVVREGNSLRLIDSSAPVPEGAALRLFTEEEVQQIVASKLWALLPAPTKDDLMFQAQSASYQEWMQEDEWESDALEGSAADSLPLSELKL